MFVSTSHTHTQNTHAWIPTHAPLEERGDHVRGDVGGAEAQPQQAEESGAVPREQHPRAQEPVERGVKLRVFEVVLLHQDEEAFEGQEGGEPVPLRVTRGEEVGELCV